MLVHIFADDKVRVLFLLFDTINGLVGPLLFTTAVFCPVLVDRGADNSKLDSKWFQWLNFTVCDQVEIFQLMQSLRHGVNDFNIGT